MPKLEILDTDRPSAPDVLAEAWHAVGANCAPAHPLRACELQTQVDIWSDVAHWMGFLHGVPLPLHVDGWPVLAEAMHADCLRRSDQAAHALIDCRSAALRSYSRDAKAILVWLAADPARREPGWTPA